jgi:hypothetical protein
VRELRRPQNNLFCIVVDLSPASSASEPYCIFHWLPHWRRNRSSYYSDYSIQTSLPIYRLSWDSVLRIGRAVGFLVTQAGSVFAVLTRHSSLTKRKEVRVLQNNAVDRIAFAFAFWLAFVR